MEKLVVDGLSCHRGDRLVFEDVSFEAAAGEVVVLTGANGMGKTSLLRTIAGLIKPHAGTVRAEGAMDPEAGIGSSTHFLGPLDALKPTLTVDESLAFWQSYFASDTGNTPECCRNRRRAACETLNLSDLMDIPAGILSTGQRRRLALARLLVTDRPLWLLDEPTLGIDTASSTTLANMITQHVTGNGIAVIATHADLGLNTIADRVRTLHFDTSEPAT